MTNGHELNILHEYYTPQCLMRNNLRDLDSFTRYEIVIVSDDVLILNALWKGDLSINNVIDYLRSILNENGYNFVYSSNYPISIFARK
jgi:hypothetical protein